MRLIFLCGSLAPGRDGVGDYTRRLASELIRQGHQASIIALNDRLIYSTIETIQETDGIAVPVLRLPATLVAKVRFARANSYIEKFNPEWLSLQYVPFSFQEKGLPWDLGSRLKKIGKGRKWHVMFHELWVGMNSEASYKLKIWGLMQQFILKKTLQQLEPELIHTQTKVYQFQLSKLGFKANYLPLFGNIPFLNRRFKKKSNEKNELSFIIFGSIHYGAPIVEFAKQVKEYSVKNKIKIKLTFIGRCGAEQAIWIKAWQEQGLAYKVLGEQPSEKISEVLSQGDLGITTTPLLLAEKSGTVAAMLEHQLNIVCVSKKWTIKDFKLPIHTPYYNFQNAFSLSVILDNTINKNSKVNLSHIANELLICFESQII